MTVLAAIMSRKAMMLKTRMTFRITYPGPARDSRSFAIMIAESRTLNLQIEGDMRVVEGMNEWRDLSWSQRELKWQEGSNWPAGSLRPSKKSKEKIEERVKERGQLEAYKGQRTGSE